MFNIKLINPFYNNECENIDELKNIHTKTALTRYLNSLTTEQCFCIMENDLELIRKSDGVVAYFDNPTIGTCQEIIMAGYVYRIPVYIITKKYTNHPWLISIALKSGGQIFKNRTEFKKFAKDEFGEKI